MGFVGRVGHRKGIRKPYLGVTLRRAGLDPLNTLGDQVGEATRPEVHQHPAVAHPSKALILGFKGGKLLPPLHGEVGVESGEGLGVQGGHQQGLRLIPLVAGVEGSTLKLPSVGSRWLAVLAHGLQGHAQVEGGTPEMLPDVVEDLPPGGVPLG